MKFPVHSTEGGMNMQRYAVLRNVKTIVPTVPNLFLRCCEGKDKCGEKPIDPPMAQFTPNYICVPENCKYMKLFLYYKGASQ